MNAHQRRRLKRIRQRQSESAERKLNQADWKFVVSHTPKSKKVCVMSDAESRKYHEVTIGHRCTSTTHRHYSRKQVDILVSRGELAWVGQHHRIAAWADHKTWAKVDSGGVAVMQLVRGLRR